MVSQLASSDTSLIERVDMSPMPSADARPCGWCKAPLSDPRARYCHQRCRQTAWRARRELSLAAALDAPRWAPLAADRDRAVRWYDLVTAALERAARLGA